MADLHVAAPPRSGATRLTVIPGERRPRRPLSGMVLGALLGLALGSSALWGGFYDIAIWGPATIVLVGIAVALSISASPRGVPALGLVAVGALLGLGALSVLSTSWAESSAQALTEAHRWFVAASALFVALLLARGRDERRALAAGGLTGIGVVAGVVLVRLLDGDEGLFFDGRLSEPLGYVNGQAAALAAGVWPLLAIAERARSIAAATLAAAAGTAVAGLVLLGASRGALAALVLSGLVLVAVAPGRTRRGWLLLVVGGCLAILHDPLLAIYERTDDASGRVAPGTIGDAAVALLAAAAIAGATWGAACAAAREVTSAGARRAATAALVAILAAGALTVAAVADPLQTARDQVDTFTELRDEGSEARFISGEGNRYDYWRIAVLEFRDRPSGGVGAGNYDTRYFVERRTDEDVRQPHSLELQVLAELGVAGAILLLAFLVAAGSAVVRALRTRAPRGPEAILALAAPGVFLAWFAHTSVDWLHLLPGLTGTALVGLAVAVTARRAVEPDPAVSPAPPPPGWRAVLPALVVCAIALPIVVGVGRLTLADRERAAAQEHLRDGEAREALEAARRSSELHPESLPTLYLEAAASARLNRYEEARATLVYATQLEPSDFVPHALLGDLAVRRGDLETARSAYGRAAALNPQDPSLKQLAADPASAAGG